MKPAPFAHHEPTTLDEALALLAQYGDDAKVLAGGQSLVPLLALRLTRFEHLIDLNRVETLRGIDRDDGWLSVRAMTRQAEAERSQTVREAVPLLHRALPHVGHFQIRNRGTVGGSTAHADPASELPAVALALGAQLEVAGPSGTGTVPAERFFVSTWTTTLAADAVVTAVRYPVWVGRCGFALEEFARRHGDFAVAGVACAVELDGDDRIARVAVALFGMGSTPVRAHEAETALLGQPGASVDLRSIAATALQGTDPVDDLHGTAAYRRRVAAHLVESALGKALGEASQAEGPGSASPTGERPT